MINIIGPTPGLEPWTSNLSGYLDVPEYRSNNFVHYLKYIVRLNIFSFVNIEAYKSSFEKRSKRGLGIRIGAYFLVPGLGLTMMVT